MPVSEQALTDRYALAVVQKATRLLMLGESPLGVWGELTEAGQAAVRPDWNITEVLYGLRYLETPDLEELVTVDDVIRAGLGHDPDDYPADKLPDVTRALSAACSWVEDYCGGLGIG